MGSSATMRIVAALCLCLAGGLGVRPAPDAAPRRGAAPCRRVNQACGDGQTSGCEDVARSSWSRVAGVPVAAYGLAFYLCLALALALALLAPREIRDALAGLVLAALALGLLVDSLLLGVQAFAIHAFCKLCILTYVLSAVAFARPAAGARGPRARRLGAAGEPEGRLALCGLGARDARARRGRLRRRTRRCAAAPRTARRTLLGAPVAAARAAAAGPPPTPGGDAAATPAPASSPAAPAGPQDAKYWQDRAQKLQATIDDPQKLEAYFAREGAARVRHRRADDARRGQGASPRAPRPLRRRSSSSPTSCAPSAATSPSRCRSSCPRPAGGSPSTS